MKNFRKAIIFLPDGMADDPLPELNGKTPLEYANTPAMDSIAARGASGTFRTLPPGLPTSSDVANMSVLGFQPELNYPGRGPIEAASQGIELAEDDVAWRCNLVYVSDDDVLRDYSAGHLSDEDSAILMAALKEEFDSEEVTFHHGVSYRNLLVLHGKQFSDKIDYQKPDSSQDIPVAELRLKPLDDSKEAAYTVKFLEELSAKAAKFLAAHPLNANRKSPANWIWPWSPGYRPAMQLFSERYAGRKGAVISAVDVIKGLGKCTGMSVIEVPGATGFLDTNYAGKVAAALEAIKENDLVYLHLEAIDECSHLGDLQLKLRAIEEFDANVVAPVLKAMEGTECNFAVLPDHPVPIKLRKHTTTPVPLAICGPAVTPDNITVFSETLAPSGTLGLLQKEELVRKVLEI
ncbi:MAG: cofactor-independent phosphoglycerate mutase [Lentisphaerae bacterium]|nr:cofactor-independent phosphoglycerate mutase [Lentisphaerota bacterium]MBQ4329497.1 cofactor-independent phosphoglycerate mutase [Lentisphaeria bacterium]